MTTPTSDTGSERVILIEDLEGFRVIDNQLRQRILHLARHPKSVKEIADALDVPVTRLYYHVNMLEEAGFLEVAEVHKVGAQLERIYQSHTGSIRPSDDFVENVGDKKKAADVLAGALFDISRLEVEAVLAKNLVGQETIGAVARAVMQLPEDAAQGFSDRLEALVTEMRDVSRSLDDTTDHPLFSFTFALVPSDTE